MINPTTQVSAKYIDRLRRFIRRNEMIFGGESILLAVSGGIDSMTLLEMMLRIAPAMRLQIGVAHFDHRLRGEASELDASFVVEQAKLRSVKSYLGQGDIKNMAGAHGWSIEEAARNARYTFLKRVARKHAYSVIMTAHSADDNAETLLLNLIRGSGVTGLAGIPPVRSLGEGIILARPLLATRRIEIEQYAEAVGLQWREDETNASDQFKRNRVRHELIPVLKEFNPAIVETLNATAEIMRSIEQFVSHSVELASDRVVVHRSADRVELSLLHLKHYLPAIQSELVQRLVSRNFNVQPIAFGAVERMLGLMWKETGSRAELGSGLICLRDRDSLCIYRELQTPNQPEMPFEPGATVDAGRVLLKTRKVEHDRVRYSSNTSIEFIDLDKVARKLVLRRWREGDRFHPFGMEGEKKVSDLLIDQKVPLDKKQHVMVVADGDTIVWVCGFRLDERYRVEPESRNILRMELARRSKNGQ